MALRLQIVSRHRQSMGERAMREFGHAGGTIGRSLESDWVLQDGQRYLSSRHASIDYRSGSYYIVDTSMNGVYVNDSERPVGRGNPQRLFTGDRVRIGEYELQVEVVGEDDTNSQFILGHEDPVSRAQRVSPPAPMRGDLVPAHAITAVGIELMLEEVAEQEHAREAARPQEDNAARLTLAEDPPPKPKTVRPLELSAGTPPIRSSPPPASATSPRGEPAAAPAGRTRTAAPSNPLDAFFRGAGLPARKLDDRQVEQTLHRLGQLMREVILGVSDNLHLRDEQKNTLRVPTRASEHDRNNPLKLPASVEEALTNLLFRPSGEYLGAVDAVRETFMDIKSHQQHLLSAVRTAVGDYIGCVDPEKLENQVSRGKPGLVNAANKLKYWDLYKDLYQIVANHEPGEFPQQFLESLTRAYEAAHAVPTSQPKAKLA